MCKSWATGTLIDRFEGPKCAAIAAPKGRIGPFVRQICRHFGAEGRSRSCELNSNGLLPKEPHDCGVKIEIEYLASFGRLGRLRVRRKRRRIVKASCRTDADVPVRLRDDQFLRKYCLSASRHHYWHGSKRSDRWHAGMSANKLAPGGVFSRLPCLPHVGSLSRMLDFT